MTKKASLANISLIAVPMIATAAILGIVATASASDRVAFENLTEEQQVAIEQIRDLRSEGNHEEAKALAEEVGLPNKHGRHHEKRTEVNEAITNNDYDTFLELTMDAPFADEITQDKFNSLVEIHALRDAGDYEAAQELREELGFEKQNRKHGQRSQQKNR